ncbi:MAG: GyrI-like domain-containing protein [Lentisphaerae bacterium]|nr:GyrI-like domain-containing protein [Lentisphaerota bacterium]MCP4101454.1 GyrI-like domain-containing protein [Lentisphaerota bacterium]
MARQIEIVERDSIPAVQKKAEISMFKLPKFIGGTYKAIFTELEKVRLKPADAPFVRYHGLNWQGLRNENKILMFIKEMFRKWNLTAGVPVDAELQEFGEFEVAATPAGKFIQTTHEGSYMKVSKTYCEMLDWADSNNVKCKNESMEIYLNDPREVKQKDLRTIVLIPVAE